MLEQVLAKKTAIFTCVCIASSRNNIVNDTVSASVRWTFGNLDYDLGIVGQTGFRLSVRRIDPFLNVLHGPGTLRLLLQSRTLEGNPRDHIFTTPKDYSCNCSSLHFVRPSSNQIKLLAQHQQLISQDFTMSATQVSTVRELACSGAAIDCLSFEAQCLKSPSTSII
eukprot:974388-Amphidinium_carterae.1